MTATEALVILRKDRLLRRVRIALVILALLSAGIFLGLDTYIFFWKKSATNFDSVWLLSSGMIFVASICLLMSLQNRLVYFLRRYCIFDGAQSKVYLALCQKKSKGFEYLGVFSFDELEEFRHKHQTSVSEQKRLVIAIPASTVPGLPGLDFYYELKNESIPSLIFYGYFDDQIKRAEVLKRLRNKIEATLLEVVFVIPVALKGNAIVAMNSVRLKVQRSPGDFIIPAFQFRDFYEV